MGPAVGLLDLAMVTVGLRVVGRLGSMRSEKGQGRAEGRSCMHTGWVRLQWTGPLGLGSLRAGNRQGQGGRETFYVT